MSDYPRYPLGTSFGTLVASTSELVAAAAALTIRVQNLTGHTIVLVSAQGFCTALSNGGATLDIQNAAAASHLAAPIALAANTVATSTAITGAAGTTVLNATDVYFVFTNNAGAGNLTNAQGTVTYHVMFATTT